MDILNLFGEPGLAHVTRILHLQGELRFLKDWDTDITDHLKKAVIRPGSAPIIKRLDPSTGSTQPYRLAITRLGATKARKFDYSKLKAEEPALYQRHVRLMAADSPLTLTFPRSTTWTQLRSEGWQDAFERWQGEKDRCLTNLQVEAETLSNVRGQVRDLEHAEKVTRMELAELIMQRDRQIRPYTYQDSVLRVAASGVRQSIDLDFAEKLPALRKYITYSDRKPFTKVWFEKVQEEEMGPAPRAWDL